MIIYFHYTPVPCLDRASADARFDYHALSSLLLVRGNITMKQVANWRAWRFTILEGRVFAAISNTPGRCAHRHLSEHPGIFTSIARNVPADSRGAAKDICYLASLVRGTTIKSTADLDFRAQIRWLGEIHSPQRQAYITLHLLSICEARRVSRPGPPPRSQTRRLLRRGTRLM